MRCCVGKRRKTKPASHVSSSRFTSEIVTCLGDDEEFDRTRYQSGPLSATQVKKQPLGVAEGQTAYFARAIKQPLCFHQLTKEALQDFMHRYETLARQDYFLGSPRVDQLVTIVQFNVLRALVSNNLTLGFATNWLEADAISPWTSTEEHRSISCPSSLLPTTLQRNVPHHPWIDFFPVPKMRDNLLLAEDSYDEYALCNDLVDCFDVTEDMTGLIVWGESWDPSGWEVSERFSKKWAWVIKGCKELLESTNYWRVTRGEDPLLLEI